jgi:hypothetical protein
VSGVVATDLTLADDVFLARFDPTTGAELKPPAGYRDSNSIMAIAAGALIELLDAGSIAFDAAGSRPGKLPDPRIVVAGAAPANPELQRAWARIERRRRPKKVKFYLTDLSAALNVIVRLQELGVLEPGRLYQARGQVLTGAGLAVLRQRRAGLDPETGRLTDPADAHAQVLASLISAAGTGVRPSLFDGTMAPGDARTRLGEVAVGGQFLGPEHPDRRAIISVLFRATAPFTT